MSSQWPGNVQYPTGHPLDIHWIWFSLCLVKSEDQMALDPLDTDRIPTGHLGIIKFALSEIKYKGKQFADTST